MIELSYRDEAAYKNALVDAFHYLGWEAQRHEEKVANHVPDLSFSGNKKDGWIEVKWCDRDPVSLQSLQHWTRGQEQWLYDRGRVGSGHCYLLVGTPRRHILWRYDVLATVRGQTFESALHYAFIIEPAMVELCATLKSRVR